MLFTIHPHTGVRDYGQFAGNDPYRPVDPDDIYPNH